MKNLIVLTLILLASFAQASEKYSVLVAGSNGYENYRHQSDVCHAYHTLLSKGFKASNIIVFSFNDVAHHESNPFPGQLFNNPKGQDVYKGCVIDYQGKDVTPENYLAVLQGNKTAVSSAGNGRVLESSSQDNVFLFFADHGAPGLVVFPDDVYLYAKDLIDTFKKMHQAKKYSKLVYYMEACESGSMFVDLPKNLNIYAVSAANPEESSYAAYCDKEAIVKGKDIGSCLGDLFSVSWMEETDSTSDVFSFSLQSQFEFVKKTTNSSHVMQWGDLSFTKEPIGNYVAEKTSHQSNSPLSNLFKGIFSYRQLSENQKSTRSNQGIVQSRKVRMNYLIHKYSSTPNSQNFDQLHEEIHRDQQFQKYFDQINVKTCKSSNSNSLSTDFDCYKTLVEGFKSKCGKIPDSQHGNFRIFYKFCASPNSENVLNILDNVC